MEAFCKLKWAAPHVQQSNDGMPHSMRLHVEKRTSRLHTRVSDVRNQLLISATTSLGAEGHVLPYGQLMDDAFRPMCLLVGLELDRGAAVQGRSDAHETLVGCAERLANSKRLFIFKVRRGCVH
jgi:hypothetical protein